MAKDDISFDPLSYAQSKLNETGDTGFDPLEYANTKLNDEVVKTSITNKVAVNGEPTTDYIDNVVKFMQKLSYNTLDDLDSSNAIDKADAEVEQTEVTKGLAKGSIKAVTSTAKFFSELTGHVDSKEWLDDTDAYLDKMLNTTSNIGEVSETIGRLGVGIWATGGLNVATVPARMAQGFAIDLLAFEGKSGNIADVFDEHNVKLGGITEALKTDMSDSELESRVKNAIGGALIGGTLESVVSAFKYGKTLVQSKGIELQGKEDAEVINIVLGELKDETKRVNSLKTSIISEEQPVITKAQFNEGEALYNRATEMIKDVPENFDELASRGRGEIDSSVRQSEADNIVRLADKGLLDVDSLKNTPLYNSLDEATKKQLETSLGSEDFFNVMENIQSTLSKDIDATLDMKQPLNADVFKISPKLEGEAGVPYAERVLKENNVSTIDEKKFWDIKSNSNTTEEALSKFDKYMKSKEFRTPEDYKTMDFQYHGTSNEITTLKNGNVTDTNIYGDGFYTTNKAEIASSYTKKGTGATPTVYKVEEIKPINNLDLDSTKIDNSIFNFESLDVGVTKDTSIREAIDKFRNESDLPKYEVTDIIDSIQQAYSKQGFNSWSHKGGEATNSAGHNVKIYFNPKEDIKITKVTPEEIKANTEAFNKARSINKSPVDATLDMKQPLNAERITPTNAETLAKATQDIEADADFITHKDLLKKADKDLKDKLGTDGYELVKDLTETAEGVTDLSLKVTQARVVVGNLAEKYQTALKVANKEGSAESYVRAMLALDNLVMVSKTLKNTTSSIAKAMSAMRINTENSQLFNSLKIMDNIDTDYSMSLLREAMSKGDNEAIIKLMENFSDTTKKLKDHVDNYQDNMFTKIGNVLSETVVAGMLSAPSTLAVNVIGNFYVKHQIVLQDSLQFLSGQVLRGSDRMKAREFRYLMQSQLLSNFNDIKLVGKNIKEWAKSGFKDETFDEAVLARYVQDQEFQHKYVSSQYIRGMEVGNTSSLFNTLINTTGKVARGPYRVIGAIDDYYKRGAFRSELVRIGSRLAEARKIPDADYTKFMDKFIRVNTELHILRNNNHKPTTTWLKTNKDYIGTGTGLHKYADEARDHANYMTFQTELKGVIGKGVDFLNSDGFLRVLVPFKLTPINMLKMSISTAFTPLKRQLYKDIFSVGGVKRDIAIAKLAYASSVLLGVGSLIQSGNMTGSFKKEERTAMQSAGIPEYSYRVGDRWFEYKQLEPIATIAGVMTDIYRLQHDLMLRADDIETTDLDTEAYTVISDLGMSIVNNIVNKTYSKSLADILAVMNGDTSIVDYGGNLLSSIVPMSSLANFIGRNFGDGYKKESSEFSEKVFSKYRVFLDRDALDAYGRPIKEIEYTPFLTKASNFDRPENVGALEVARLGINIHKMSKTVTYQGIPVKLEPEEYWTMRRNLDTKFQLADKLTEVVSSGEYKSQSDFIKKQILSNLINQVKLGASQTILTDSRVLGELQKGSSKVLKQATETEPQSTYNTMILKGLSDE